MGSPDWGVDITWHGQSCFTLRDSLGRTFVTDPFDETVGYGRLDLRADALLITHDHFDHNNRRAVKPRLRALDIVESTGAAVVGGGVAVTGLGSFHDAEDGGINGPNRIFTFVLGGIKFVHLGDLGQLALTEEQKKLIGPVDVLFIPVGGVTTIDARQAKMLIDELKPAVVFPMHYGESRFYRLAPVSLFLNMFPEADVRQLSDAHVRLRRSDFAGRPVVMTLKPTQRNY